MASAPVAQRRDKRSQPRAAIEIAVSCERPNAAPIFGTARDLGMGGVFIESTEQPPVGAVVLIAGRLPGASHGMRLGIVRWAKSNGFGVQFGLLGAQEMHATSTDPN